MEKQYNEQQRRMAAIDMLVREGVALTVQMSVISMVDRRDHVSDEPVEWVFQRDVEAILYGNGSASPASLEPCTGCFSAVELVLGHSH